MQLQTTGTWPGAGSTAAALVPSRLSHVFPMFLPSVSKYLNTFTIGRYSPVLFLLVSKVDLCHSALSSVSPACHRRQTSPSSTWHHRLSFPTAAAHQARPASPRRRQSKINKNSNVAHRSCLLSQPPRLNGGCGLRCSTHCMYVICQTAEC